MGRISAPNREPQTNRDVNETAEGELKQEIHRPGRDRRELDQKQISGLGNSRPPDAPTTEPTSFVETGACLPACAGIPQIRRRPDARGPDHLADGANVGSLKAPHRPLATLVRHWSRLSPRARVAPTKRLQEYWLTSTAQSTGKNQCVEHRPSCANSGPWTASGNRTFATQPGRSSSSFEDGKLNAQRPDGDATLASSPPSSSPSPQ
jgi:hypothetical protein